MEAAVRTASGVSPTVEGARIKLDSADGDYGIEVHGVRGSSIVVLREDRFNLPKQTQIDL